MVDDLLPFDDRADSVPQLAERWDVSPALIWKELAAGRLRSVKIGKLRRILPEHRKAYERSREVKP